MNKVSSAAALKILLVEDEPADAHLVRLAFRESHLNIQLEQVDDGLQALNFLHQRPPYTDAMSPGLILLDLNMPRMDGKELLKSLKSDEALMHFPVVILTTSDADKDIEECYKLGAAGYITKPIDIDQFIQVIKSLGEYWSTILQVPRKA